MPKKQLPIAGAIATGLALVISQNVQAQVLYGTAGVNYFQDFNSLPSAPENVNLQTQATPTQWADNSTTTSSQFSLTGWYLYHGLSLAEGGANGHQRVRIGSGSGNTGAFMSFGSTGSTERSLGDVGSTTLVANGGDVFIGLRVRNTTGQTLTSFTLTYNGEQWRDGGAVTPVAQGMTFGYSTTATAINDPSTSFTAVASLGYNSPVFANTGSGAAVDGNNAGRVNGITETVTGLSWADGTDLWLRWDDIQNAGNDHGLSIDDVNFVAFAAVPEPTTWAVFTMGALAFVGYSRRKQK